MTEVGAAGPAYKAGIKRNDVIVEFDGYPIKNLRELPMRVAHSRAGQKISLKLVWEGKTLSLTVVLAETPQRTSR